MVRYLLPLLFVVAPAAEVWAQGAQMVERIDALIAQRWQAEGVAPAPVASDAEFLRRAYLDLNGVVPRVSEVRAFLADDDPAKRHQLVDRLLASPRYATHMATTWQNRLLGEDNAGEQMGQVLGVHTWLRNNFARNRRFDGIVADLLVATDGSDVGPALYFLAHDLAPEKLAASTAELFLGMHLECAQCHNHPYDRWSQRDFWGYAAFFARVRGPENAMQTSNFRLTDARSGEVTIPDTREVVPPKYLGGELADPAEGGTRRLQLSIWMASRDNPYLARATVNWAWGHLFGRGLIDPVGDAGDHNPPSHPELLDALAEYMVAIDFDLARLWRTLAASQAYQLSSRHHAAEPPPAELFAAMNTKVLTPEQLYDSLARAAPPPQDQSYANNSANMPDNIVLDFARGQFVRLMRTPSDSPTEFSAGILQALRLMNGAEMTTMTSLSDQSVVAAVEAPYMTDDDQIDALFLATLSRFPREEERPVYGQYLTSSEGPENRREALSDILWALLNSSEFGLNH